MKPEFLFGVLGCVLGYIIAVPLRFGVIGVYIAACFTAIALFILFVRDSKR
jgi:hypothetical protein